MPEPAQAPLEAAVKWQIEDIRGVTSVVVVGRRPIGCTCAFCERAFVATQWVSLSVARDGVGGATVDLCQSCAEASWEALSRRLSQVAEMLSVADEIRRQNGAL